MQPVPLLSKSLLLYNLLPKSSYISTTLRGSLPLTLTVFIGNPEPVKFRKIKKTYCAG